MSVQHKQRADWIALALLVLIAAVWSSVAIHHRPDAVFSRLFLFADAGFALTVTDQLLAGRTLYQEVAYQYGPIPAFVHQVVAALFGNTAEVYVRFFQCCTLIQITLAYCVVRRGGIRPATAASYITLAVLPAFVLPGTLTAVSIGPTYAPLERILLLTLALTWRPLTVRRIAPAFGFGVMLALANWIKFGGAYVALAAFVTIDLLFLARRRTEHGQWVTWLRGLAWIGGGFVTMEVARSLFLFSIASPEIALDAFWPLYMLKSYAGYVTPLIRFPQWHNLAYFVGVQLPVATSAALLLLMLQSTLGHRPNDGSAQHEQHAGPFLFLAAFFGWGLLVYFKHVWLVMEASWLLIIAAAYPFSRLRLRWQILVAILWLPCFWLNVKWLAQTDSAKQRVQLPNREELLLSSDDAALVSRLEPVLRSLGAIGNEQPPRPTLVMRLPSGIHHYFNLTPGMRHSWFIPAAVRHYDEPAVAATLDRAVAVVLFLEHPTATPPGTDPRTWDWSPLLSPPFNDRVCELFAARLQPPIKVDGRCFVFPVR